MKITSLLISSLLALPALSADAPTDNVAPAQYSEKHKDISADLAELQDELQADASDLIMDETKKETVDLLKKCRKAMNDAIDNLELYNTGGETLAAQSDVIELIYQASKSKMQGADGKPKPGSKGMMDMLRQMLGMDSSGEDQEGGEQQNGDGEGDSKQQGKKKETGKKPGQGADGKSNMAANQERGISDPDTMKENRTVPKSTGIGTQDMPSEFREALEAYNKTLQK